MLKPIRRDLDVMRQTLLYGALECIAFNQNRRISDLKMFEFGRVYSMATSGDDPLPGYHEEKHLSLILTGQMQTENWNSTNRPADFYKLKGCLEGICDKLTISRDQFTVEPYNSTLITEGLQYLHHDKSIFVMGTISSQLLKAFDCKQPVYYAEVNWDRLFSLIHGKSMSYKGSPKFREVRRDFALLVDTEITFAQIEKLAFQTERRLLKNVGLFDVYEGDKIASGKKSYAMSFILQDEEKTLTDKEIEKAMEKLMRAMASGFNAQLR